jgi:hypothetical protein
MYYLLYGLNYSHQVVEFNRLSFSLIGVITIYTAGPFQRSSSVWRTAGFQKEDPVLDLKTSGVRIFIPYLLKKL